MCPPVCLRVGHMGSRRARDTLGAHGVPSTCCNRPELRAGFSGDSYTRMRLRRFDTPMSSSPCRLGYGWCCEWDGYPRMFAQMHLLWCTEPAITTTDLLPALYFPACGALSRGVLAR